MAELSTILADGYDREAFERALGRSDALGELTSRLGRLLPHAEPLVGDIFCALFKLNAVLHPEKAVAASVLINRSLEMGGMAKGLRAALDQAIAIETLDTPSRRRFREIATRDGLRAALAWRDARIDAGDDGEVPA